MRENYNLEQLEQWAYVNAGIGFKGLHYRCSEKVAELIHHIEYLESILNDKKIKFNKF